MAYIVQQLRKNNNNNGLDTYRSLIECSVVTSTASTGMISTTPSFDTINGRNFKFRDYTVSSSTTLKSGEVYFLQYEICKIPEGYYVEQGRSYYPNELNIDIVIRNSASTSQNVEIIGDIKIPSEVRETVEFIDGSPIKQVFTEKIKGTLIFSPTTDCDQLGFKIRRTGYDYLIETRNWLIDPIINPPSTVYQDGTVDIEVKGENNESYSGVIAKDKIVVTNLCSLNNLVPSGIKWLKFGFQSRPGTLIAVNKEPIVVGRSGVYEINNGTKISQFMIATPGNDINKVDAFLLDFAYETNS